MQQRMIYLTMAYTMDTERTRETHVCSCHEEANYLITLTRQLAPLEFEYSKKWVSA